MPDTVTQSILQWITEYFNYCKKSRGKVNLCSVLWAVTFIFVSKFPNAGLKTEGSVGNFRKAGDDLRRLSSRENTIHISDNVNLIHGENKSQRVWKLVQKLLDIFCKMKMYDEGWNYYTMEEEYKKCLKTVQQFFHSIALKNLMSNGEWQQQCMGKNINLMEQYCTLLLIITNGKQTLHTLKTNKEVTP